VSAKKETFLITFGTPGHSIRSSRLERITFFRFLRRAPKAILFCVILGAEILSKPFWDPLKKTHTKNAAVNSKKKIRKSQK
jgi:hypothetical protein